MGPITADDLREQVEELFRPPGEPSRPGAVGVEIELIPVTVPRDGLPDPVPLESAGHGPSLLAFLTGWGEGRLVATPDSDGSPAFVAGTGAAGGRLSFEPGGQLEFSTRPRATVREVGEDLRGFLGPLVEDARRSGIVLAARGMNPWHTSEGVGLQVASPRYRAMDQYFARVGPHGRRMMRLSASMQVNLDLGTGSEVWRRWRAANLLAPVCTASFANSPGLLGDGRHAVSARAATWRRVDPSRTGSALVAAPGAATDPVRQYLVFALKAAVMLRRSEDGSLREETGGMRFNEWWAGDHAPRPGSEEWQLHLSTLFPDVRPRRRLELRAMDVPGLEWWLVPPTLAAALLYDELALSDLLETLEPWASGIDALAERAAVDGLRDPALGSLAGFAFRLALETISRYPAGYFGDEAVDRLERFLTTHVERRTMQADEWAGAEPVRVD